MPTIQKVPAGVSRIERKLDWPTTHLLLHKERSDAWDKLAKIPFEDPGHAAAEAEYDAKSAVVKLAYNTPHHLFEMRTCLNNSISSSLTELLSVESKAAGIGGGEGTGGPCRKEIL